MAAETLSVRETAKRLGRNHQVLYKAIKDTGEVLPGVRAFKIGSSWRISTVQVDEFLRTGRVSAA